jgi:hypothetical protein
MYRVVELGEVIPSYCDCVRATMLVTVVAPVIPVTLVVTTPVTSAAEWVW